MLPVVSMGSILYQVSGVHEHIGRADFSVEFSLFSTLSAPQ